MWSDDEDAAAATVVSVIEPVSKKLKVNLHSAKYVVTSQAGNATISTPEEESSDKDDEDDEDCRTFAALREAQVEAAAFTARAKREVARKERALAAAGARAS